MGKNKRLMMNDLTGQKFGKLTVIKRAGSTKYHCANWECLCDCGNKKIISGNSLTTGKTKSCGCICKEINNSFKHGHSKRNRQSKIYITWKNMKARCNKTNNKRCKDWGGRGITVCERWSNKINGFQNFLEDIGEPPTNKHQIDRIDNNKLINGYSPENCRWSTPKEQNRNRRTSHLISYDNKNLCCAEWEEITGIPQRTIARRIIDGWSIKEALLIPIRKHKQWDNLRNL